MKKRISIFSILVLLISLVSITSIPVLAEEPTTKITLLHTNDMHARIAEGEYDGMGYAKLATYIEKYRAENPNTLLFDAGDTFHGLAFATITKGSNIVDLMNELNYDAMTVGNHDFNYGSDRLLALQEEANFPLLANNIYKTDGSLFLPATTIKEVDGIKIGIFGMATPETLYKTNPKNVDSLDFTDPAVEAQKSVDFLKGEGVDFIIALAHLGTDGSSTDTSYKVMKAVDGIDVLIDGHSHTALPNGEIAGNGTLLASSGEYSKNLGVVELEFTGKVNTKKTAKLITKEEAKTIEPNAKMTELIKQKEEALKPILNQVVGQSGVILDGLRENVRAKETNLGNLLTDAMIDISKAEIAITNGGGIRSSVDSGDVTRGDLIAVAPFGNYIVTKYLTGAQVLKALENGASKYPDAHGAFAHVSGMKYSIDPNKEAGSRIHSVIVNGEPLDKTRKYLVATNDFLAVGGDQYTMFKEAATVNEFPALEEALIEYMGKVGTVNTQVEGRITEAPTPLDVPENTPKPTEKVMWEGLLLKPGQIGKVTIDKPINLWKKTDNGKLEFVRILNKGEVYRVYGYSQNHFGQYAVGAGHYVTNIQGYTSYKTPSKAKLALVNEN
ncbi:MAG: 5'-nucleotidase C-terminal domain-containing protein [Melioribacteraceae bacterium]|nr:5'-nucleotidase C-terminal domain-containing protein [Melioribacteraceae bacterium]